MAKQDIDTSGNEDFYRTLAKIKTMFGDQYADKALTARAIGPRASNILTSRRHSGPGQSAVTGFTYRQLLAVPGQFSHVRAVFYNPGDVDLTVEKIYGAPSAQIGANPWNPVDASGANVALTQFTTNDNAAKAGDFGRSAPSYPGTNTSLLVPKALANPLVTPYSGDAPVDNVPGSACTDWMPIASLPRLDGDYRPYFILSVSSATSRIPVASVGAANMNAWDPLSQGWVSQYFAKSGDDAATAGATGFGKGGSGPYCMIQFLSSTTGIIIQEDGDSLSAGAGSAGAQNSSLHQLTALLSTAKVPVSMAEFGVPSSTSSGYQARFQRHLEETRANIVILRSWSPNDPKTQVSADIQAARVLALADFAARRGAVPVILTPLPNNTLDGPGDAARLSVRTTVMNSGYLYVDLEPLGTGASPNRIQPAIAADSTHLTDAGYAQQAMLELPVVQMAIALVRRMNG